MRALVADTNVVSILFREIHPLYSGCARAVEDHQLTISFMTKAELLQWPRRNNWGERSRELLQRHIAEFTTLFPDERTCEIWAELRDERRRLGRPIDPADSWIAAAAIQWDVPLVTTNVRDFESIDGLLVEPIDAG